MRRESECSRNFEQNFRRPIVAQPSLGWSENQAAASEWSFSLERKIRFPAKPKPVTTNYEERIEMPKNGNGDFFESTDSFTTLWF
jgi:hypothetical protein